jgi:hypothetical protein
MLALREVWTADVVVGAPAPVPPAGGRGRGFAAGRSEPAGGGATRAPVVAPAAGRDGGCGRRLRTAGGGATAPAAGGDPLTGAGLLKASLLFDAIL